MLSFKHDAEVKQQLLDQLQSKQAQSQLWEKNILAWNGTTGSVVGHAIQSADLAEWEQLGLPKWLAIAVDYFFITAATIEQGIETGIAILDAIPTGVQLSGSGSQFLYQLLSSAHQGLASIAMSAENQAALQQVLAIHQQCLAGQNIAPSVWRELRKTLVQHTNQYEVNSLDHRIGVCLEAAAWDPESSRSVVADVIRAWVMLQTARVVAECWTPEDDQLTHKLLKQLYEEAKAVAKADEAIDVHAILEQRYPEHAIKLKHFLKTQNQQPAIFAELALDLLKHVFANAR